MTRGRVSGWPQPKPPQEMAAASSLLVHALAATRENSINDGNRFASMRKGARRIVVRSRQDRSRSRSLHFERTRRQSETARQIAVSSDIIFSRNGLPKPREDPGSASRPATFRNKSPRQGCDRDKPWIHDKWKCGYGLEEDPAVGSVVFVRGLPSDITQREVHSNFSKCGSIAYIKVDYRGNIVTAEVGFEKRDAAAAAVSIFHGASVRRQLGGPIAALKVAIVDRMQQPGSVVQPDEELFEEPARCRVVSLGSPGLNSASGGSLAADTQRVSIFDRLS